MKLNNTVQKTIEILKLLSQSHDGLSLTQIVNRLDIPKSSVYDILVTLTQFGFLKLDDVTKTYKVGVEAFTVGSSFLKTTNLESVARHYLTELRHEINETVYLAGRKGIHDSVYLLRFNSNLAFQTVYSVGDVRHLLSNALGKAILAGLSDDEVYDSVTPEMLATCTMPSIRDFKSLIEILDISRKQGFVAETTQENPEFACAVSAPVMNTENEPIAAVSIVVMQNPTSQERISILGKKIHDVAQQISYEIGFTGNDIFDRSKATKRVFTVIDGDESKVIQFNKSDTFFSALRREYNFISPCGGNGKCGKCQIEFTSAKGEVSKVLACKTPASEGSVVCSFIKKYSSDSVQKSFLGIKTSKASDRLEIAVDIGTTTVVAYLVNCNDGSIVKTVSSLNNQSKYGADVISRISFATASEENKKEMQQTIALQLSSIINELTDKEIKSITVAANPTMTCFLTGIDTKQIGFAPFVLHDDSPILTNTSAIGIPTAKKMEVYLPGSISAYVGSDITLGLLCSSAYQNSKNYIYLDLGTNGEIVLHHDGKYVCCSTAAGPAFEGASITFGTGAIEGAISGIGRDFSIETINDKPVSGICGSGIIDCVAALIDNNIIDETGRMEEALVSEYNGVPALDLYEGKIFFTQKDVRELQIAKAAIQAGILTLLESEKIKPEDIDVLYIAGSFGSHVNPKSCETIGMFAGIKADSVVSIGNAAGLGAVSLAANHSLRLRAEELRKKIRYIELFKSKSFQSFYTDSMFFGEYL